MRATRPTRSITSPTARWPWSTKTTRVARSCSPISTPAISSARWASSRATIIAAPGCARSQCEVAEISYNRFRQLAQEDPDILFALASQMALRLRRTSNMLSRLAFMDVAGRVARTLLDLAKEPDAMPHPAGMQIRLTRQELGRIVGCSREMVGRVLKNLEQQNLISAKGKTIVVHGARRSALRAASLHSGARRSTLAHRAQAHNTVGLSGSSLGLPPFVGFCRSQCAT